MSDPNRPARRDEPDLYLPTSCIIEAVQVLTSHEKLFRLRLPEEADLGHQPGQFVQVSLPGFGEAPISVASAPSRNERFELGIRRVGTLTSALHNLKPGDSLGIRGPFGRPFETSKLIGKDLLLISGGCGLAPMRSLIQYCEARPADFGRLTILYGAKSPEEMLFKDEIAAWEASERFACSTTVDQVPDGACYSGNLGLVTRLIPSVDFDPTCTVAVIVGPPVMYRSVIQELSRRGLSESAIVVSLERHMNCGVGKCGHCAIDHLYCCTDGPVFWLNEISAIKGWLP